MRTLQMVQAVGVEPTQPVFQAGAITVSAKLALVNTLPVLSWQSSLPPHVGLSVGCGCRVRLDVIPAYEAGAGLSRPNPRLCGVFLPLN